MADVSWSVASIWWSFFFMLPWAFLAWTRVLAEKRRDRLDLYLRGDGVEKQWEPIVVNEVAQHVTSPEDK